MEQRTPRLGDIVDDYCPRERRVTNHAIVAIVEEAIRQTRCTACNTEHVFKGGQEPRRRIVKPGLVAHSPAVVEMAAAERVAVVEREPEPSTAPEHTRAAPAQDGTPASAEPGPADGWAAHRRLIRATLPKTGGEPPEPRPIPEVTMHQRPPQGRPGRPFRFDHSGRGNSVQPFRGRPMHGGGNGSVNGNGSKDDEDEVNGNIGGGGAPGHGRGGHGGPAEPGGPGPGGRRRRGRRRRGR
jgi:hypothetical protein